jgi:hypothetical protein
MPYRPSVYFSFSSTIFLVSLPCILKSPWFGASVILLIPDKALAIYGSNVTIFSSLCSRTLVSGNLDDKSLS